MTASSSRRPWVAALLSAFCQGVGHLYAGRPLIAIAVYGVATAFAVVHALAMRTGLGATLATLAAGLAFWVGQALLAARAARRAPAEPRPWFSRPLALVALGGAAALGLSAVSSFTKATIAHAVYAPSGSMIPTVQSGDYVIVAGGAPRDLRGAIVIFRAPPSHPRGGEILKRIVAVEGDTVELRDGHLVLNGEPVPYEPVEGRCTYEDRFEGGPWRDEPCVEFVERLGDRAYHIYCTPWLPCGDVEPQTVPPGHVWVAGDHRDHSADSRVFGPVGTSAIVGEVRWVFASWGPNGPRSGRFGLRL